MRKTLLLLLLLSAKLAFGQFRDDFSDGNFTVNPVWTGQTSSFKVNAGKQLQSSLSSVAQTISISSSNNLALNVRWEFSIQLNFDPSSTNLARIYLVSDQADLKGSLNGYFIQIGENGSTDSYDLFRQAGNVVTKIIDGPPKNRANINFLSTKLRVTRDDQGKWEVYTSLDDGASYSLEGIVNDKTFTNTSWFGVYCRYTATRSEGFVFDDFVVEELVEDVTPPSLLGIKVVDASKMEITFSEAIRPQSALVSSNYLIKELNEHPVSVDTTYLPHVFRLSFKQNFLSGSYTLVVNDAIDLKGNISDRIEAFTTYIKPYIAKKGDLVINEIFADPSPQVGLPLVEFVELWNTTNEYLLLEGWKYKDLTSTNTFLADTLSPYEHVILCAAKDVQLFKRYGKTIGLSVWPTLNNDKDRLTLINAQNLIIDDVYYADSWYKNSGKSDGGFSLELIDPANRCSGIQNWQVSEHNEGGTPGVQNSVYQKQLNLTSPKIQLAKFIDETTIQLDFNRSLDSLSLATLDHYHLNNGVGRPMLAVAQFPDFSTVLLKFSTPITKGLEYSLSVINLTDCAGNVIDQAFSTAKLFMAKEIGKSDILISEILVNPKIGGVDFIEIYNATDHVLDLATLKLATIDGSGNTTSIKNVSEVTVYIPSKAFWVLTSNIEAVKQQYEVKNPTHFTKMLSLPAFNNEKGTVVLLADQGVIDRLDYHEKMHFPLLRIVKGVALERVSFQKKTNEKGNFKSSSQLNGFGTPTYKNSQEETTVSKNEVWLSAKVFSPDGDGIDDVLNIYYQFLNLDYLANLTIYNEKGIAIKRLLKNSNIPKEGELLWDGLDDMGRLCSVGIYIIKFEVFSLSGKRDVFEKVCVLGAKLE